MVVPLAAKNEIQAGAREQVVVAIFAFQPIVAIAAVKDVLPLPPVS